MILTHKTDAMDRLLHLVSHGATAWTGGSVAPGKAEALALKFTDRYGVGMTAQQRWRAKRRGVAAAHLVMLAEPDQPVRWWLLATEGDGLIRQIEALADARGLESRIVMTGYELMQAPRKGALSSWTWRMPPEAVEAWRSRLELAIRHGNDYALRQTIHSLRRTPGYREARKQAYALLRGAEGDWKRVRADPWPFGSSFIAYRGKYRQAETIEAGDLRKKKRETKRSPAPSGPGDD